MVALVLLGAGASFGSADVKPYAPPLGNGDRGLFSRLEERGGLAADLPVDLKAMFRNNFEQGMAAFYEYADGDIMAFQRQLAEYLAGFEPGPDNVYRSLVERIGVKRAIYSTLNYDLLFEQAVHLIRLNTTYSALAAPNCVRLLKIHGSSNFWPDIPLGVFQGLRSSRGGVADVVAPVRPLNREQTLHRCQADDSFAPAIAMYAEGKQVKVCPDYVSDQQTQWSRVAERAKRVLISGVRIHPSDAHIWGRLAKTNAAVFYFGLGADKEEFLRWKDLNMKRNAYYVEADFARAVNHMARLLA